MAAEPPNFFLPFLAKLDIFESFESIFFFQKKTLIYSFFLVLAPYEKDLCTKMVQIQTKRYYLDVKENRRGKFIKVGFVVVLTIMVSYIQGVLYVLFMKKIGTIWYYMTTNLVLSYCENMKKLATLDSSLDSHF